MFVAPLRWGWKACFNLAADTGMDKLWLYPDGVTEPIRVNARVGVEGVVHKDEIA